VVFLLARWPILFALLSIVSGQPADEGIRYFNLKDPEPEPSLAWFILNAFFLIGVVLLAAIAVGIAFGGFRLWLLERFPHNRFNGAPEDEISQSFRLTDDRER
jgi:hypothetical protein